MFSRQSLPVCTAQIFLAAIIALANCGFAVSQTPQTIIDFRLSTGSDAASNDVEANSSTFETIDDGLSLQGDQLSDIFFQGFLQSQTDVLGGSISISGISLGGTAQPPGVGQVFTPTTGGVLELFDQNDVLLLSANLGDGVLSGDAAPAGAFANGAFNNISTPGGVTTFTGGTLLPFVDQNSGLVTLALNDIRSGSDTGIQVDGSGASLPFTADATGQISASVPEPTTLPLLAFTIAVFSGTRRRSVV